MIRNNNTVLLIEDDAHLGKGLRDYLESEQLTCHWIQDISQIEKYWYKVDLVILDRTLPDGDSLRHLPKWLAKKAVPVIVLTAHVEVRDCVVGLAAGARDYITKPFSHIELMARISTQLRPIGEGRLSLGRLHLFPARHAAYWHDMEVALTPTEFALVMMLVQMAGRVFTRDELLNQVWGYQYFPSTRTVDTHILQLRQKLPGIEIDTVRGVGYRLRKEQ